VTAADSALARAGLEAIYAGSASAQAARYQAARSAFLELYGPGPVHIFRAPGRVNLIGEHTDYNHGYVLPVALDRDVLLLARPLAQPTVYLHNAEAQFAPTSFSLGKEIPPASAGDWTNYVRGAAQMVVQHRGGRVRGMQALVEAAPPYGVPRGAGVSSSSALTVAAALALALLNDWQPEPVQFARLCSEAEWYVGTRGGIMDQFCALLARPGHALFLDCRPLGPDRYRLDHVVLPPEYRLLVADSGVHHANVRGEFNLRVAACRTGVACLRSHFPGITHLRDVQTVEWDELARLLPDALSVAEARALGADLDDLPLPTTDAQLRVRACCRHVHSENARVLATVAALQEGAIAAVGRLLDEAHASARDDYDISCAELEALVEAARGVAGTLGARLTGAGWGGCIVALVHRDAVEEFTAHVADRYRAATGRAATIFACRAGGGAGLVAVL
jgi:galactokinase